MTFNPTRLTIARKRCLLTKKALAERIGVAPITILRCEQGESEPSPDSVRSLSKALDFPQEFFFGPDLDEPLSEVTSFRSQTSMTAALRDAALAAGSIGFLISDWVEKRFNLPVDQLPDLSGQGPEEAARALREQWGLGERPISSMLNLLEAKGIRTFSLAENTTTVNAYSLWRGNIPYVFLNTYKSAECGRFDAAHELGHLVLHQDGKSRGREAEDQANAFASSFLMPKADVVACLPRGVMGLHHIITAKTRWKVSAAALAHRLNRLGLISDWKYRDYCIEMSRLGYFKREPQGIQRERSLVWDKVLKALWAEQTTQDDIARELHIPVSELSSLVFGIVNPENELDSSPTRFSSPLALL